MGRFSVLFLVLLVAGCAAQQDVCNFKSHHSHLVVPLAKTYESCTSPSATFLLSHGATFFCPHTYDIKQLATFEAAGPQALVCKAFFQALSVPTASLKLALRPTLNANELPATGSGEVTSWTSPVLYQVHAFGQNRSSGPGEGWNTTTLYDGPVTVNFRNLYARQFSMGTPQPTALTYLLYNASGTLFMTHFIASAPSFDDIVLLSSVAQLPAGLTLPAEPLLLVFSDREDAYPYRVPQLTQLTATLHYQGPEGRGRSAPIQVSTARRVYAGIDDGFADFGYNCPQPPPYPQHPSLCSGRVLS